MKLKLIFLLLISIFNSQIEAKRTYNLETYFSPMVLKPMASNMEYVAIAYTLPAESPHWSVFDLHPKYHFAFSLGFAAHFKNAQTCLKANWQRIHTNDSSSLSVPSGADMVGPISAIGPDSTEYNSATGNVTFHFDEANLIYGQKIDVSTRLQTTIFTGISAIHLAQVVTATYVDPNGTSTRMIQAPQSFNGAGVQFGLEFEYALNWNVYLLGKGSAAILAGRLHNNTIFNSTSPIYTAAPVNEQSITVNDRSQVVPSFNQRLGFGYQRIFNEHYNICLEAGYQTQIYLNALQSVNLGSGVDGLTPAENSVGEFARTFQRALSNFALAGAFFNISFIF